MIVRFRSILDLRRFSTSRRSGNDMRFSWGGNETHKSKPVRLVGAIVHCQTSFGFRERVDKLSVTTRPTQSHTTGRLRERERERGRERERERGRERERETERERVCVCVFVCIYESDPPAFVHAVHHQHLKTTTRTGERVTETREE